MTVTLEFKLLNDTRNRDLDSGHKTVCVVLTEADNVIDLLRHAFDFGNGYGNYFQPYQYPRHVRSFSVGDIVRISVPDCRPFDFVCMPIGWEQLEAARPKFADGGYGYGR